MDLYPVLVAAAPIVHTDRGTFYATPGLTEDKLATFSTVDVGDDGLWCGPDTSESCNAIVDQFLGVSMSGSSVGSIDNGGLTVDGSFAVLEMSPGSSPFSSISFDVVAAEASQRLILYGLNSLGAHPLLDVVGPSGFYGVTFPETSFRLLQWSLENTALNQLIDHHRQHRIRYQRRLTGPRHSGSRTGHGLTRLVWVCGSGHATEVLTGQPEAEALSRSPLLGFALQLRGLAATRNAWASGGDSRKVVATHER